MNNTYLDFTFSDPRAVDLFKYISGPGDNNIRWRAWYSAYKFGATVTAPGFASYKDGVFVGIRASEAAEYAKKHSLSCFDLYDVEKDFAVMFIKSDYLYR